MENIFYLLEQRIIEIYAEGSVDILLLGDTNIDWSAKSTRHLTKYKTFLKTGKLTQLINEPTRVTVNSNTIIDHIVTNRGSLLERVYY